MNVSFTGVQTLPSRDIAKSIEIVRDLDKILDALKEWGDCRQAEVHETYTCMQELSAFVDAANEGVLWRQLHMCKEGLKLRISKMIFDLPAESEEAMHTSNLSLQDIADAWTQILWERTTRTKDCDGKISRHF